MRNLLITCLLYMAGQGQSFAQGFNKHYDFGYPGNSFEDIAIYNDTIVGIGEAYSDSTLIRQGIFLVELDSNGSFIRKKIFLDSLGGNFFLFEGADKIVKCSDGGYAFVAASYERLDAYLYKLDKNWNVEFVKEYLDTVNIANFPYSLFEVPNGYMLYGVNVTPDLKRFGFVRRVDLQGNQLWEKKFFWTGYDYTLTHVVPLSDSTFLTSAHLKPPPWDDYKYFTDMRILDGAGNQLAQWNNEINDNIGFMFRVLPLEDGGFVAAGMSVDTVLPFYTLFNQSVVRFKPNFEVDWVRHWGAPDVIEGQTEYSDLLRTSGNTILAFGQSTIRRPNADAYQTAYFAKISLQGSEIWKRDVPVPTALLDVDIPNKCYGAGLLSSGSIIGSGEIDPNVYYAWLIKLTRDGCLDTLFACTPTSSTQVPVPRQVGMLTIAPNPAREHARVFFPESLHQGRLTVLDALGHVQFQQTIRMGAGSHQLDVSGYPAGLYHTVLEGTDGRRMVGRLVVTRGD